MLVNYLVDCKNQKKSISYLDFKYFSVFSFSLSMISQSIKFSKSFLSFVAIKPPSPAAPKDLSGCKEKHPALPKVPTNLF